MNTFIKVIFSIIVILAGGFIGFGGGIYLGNPFGLDYEKTGLGGVYLGITIGIIVSIWMWRKTK